jgi:hypothetical protein
MTPKIAYTILGLPTHYHGMDYSDTKLIASRIDGIREKISKAPQSGVLLVSGTAAPIINQLIGTGRKTIGIDFVQYFNSKLSNEETMDLPRANVVLIYNVGAEPANNATFSGKLLNSLLSFYKSSLVVIESDKTPTAFSSTYSLAIANSIIVAPKDVERWI